MTVPGELNALIERFDRDLPSYCSAGFNEAQVRIDFSDPEDVARQDRMVGLVERMLELHERLAGEDADRTPDRKLGPARDGPMINSGCLTLLDTNIVIALFARDETVLRELSNAQSGFVPVIVLGELFYGAYGSHRFDENMSRMEEFASVTAVLDGDAATARHYAQIKIRLREAGRPIPENDIWIAALARQHGLTLVSRDSHFSEVKNLETATWH